MVTDAAGSSVVIESRNSEISVIPSDICTNFYLGSDDMEDRYAGIGGIGDSPERCAEPAYERIRYFHDTV